MRYVTPLKTNYSYSGDFFELPVQTGAVHVDFGYFRGLLWQNRISYIARYLCK